MTAASGVPDKLTVSALGKRFDLGGAAFDALRDVSFGVAVGEFVAIVGASGCGKSTLLRIIAGLDAPSSGEVRMDRDPVQGPHRDRAMVFQDYSLYPWLTVMENIEFSLRLKAASRGGAAALRAGAHERAQLLLALMGLEHVRDALPNALSGGMRQRVAIARALLGRPELLLMDEPFGALDAQTREVMHELILHVRSAERGTIMFVTHDVEEAVYLADRVLVLAPGPGRVDSIWEVALPPACERTPPLKRSAEFVALESRILDRIRATSGVQRDLAALHRLSR